MTDGLLRGRAEAGHRCRFIDCAVVSVTAEGIGEQSMAFSSSRHEAVVPSARLDMSGTVAVWRDKSCKIVRTVSREFDGQRHALKWQCAMCPRLRMSSRAVSSAMCGQSPHGTAKRYRRWAPADVWRKHSSCFTHRRSGCSCSGSADSLGTIRGERIPERPVNRTNTIVRAEPVEARVPSARLRHGLRRAQDERLTGSKICSSRHLVHPRR